MEEQLIKPQIKWTEDKIELLKKEYPYGDKKSLAKKLGISQKTLKCAALRFGIKSLKEKNKYKLKILYEDSPLAYYWLGFVMADGHISKNGELKITLSEKDSCHLKKIADFLNININYHKIQTNFSNNKERNYCSISCKDSFYGIKILSKLGLNGLAKTYNPPSKLKIENNCNFLSFLIGFIDGDGTFSKNKKNECNFIKIESHASWIVFFEYILKQLNLLNIGNVTIGINKRGFSFIKIYKHKNLVALKLFAKKNNLPFLGRKWDLINENKIISYNKKDDKNLNIMSFINT